MKRSVLVQVHVSLQVIAPQVPTVASLTVVRGHIAVLQSVPVHLVHHLLQALRVVVSRAAGLLAAVAATIVPELLNALPKAVLLELLVRDQVVVTALQAR